ncbi:MAG: hypothetical protein WD875_05445, partial [Pirellulales bacterium]
SVDRGITVGGSAAVGPRHRLRIVRKRELFDANSFFCGPGGRFRVRLGNLYGFWKGVLGDGERDRGSALAEPMPPHDKWWERWRNAFVNATVPSQRMDDTGITRDMIGIALAIEQLDGTIDYALRRCLTVSNLVERLIGFDEDIDTADVDQLCRMELCASDHESLVQAIWRLSDRGKTSAAKLKARIDRTILRILRILPAEMAQPFAEQYLGHRLKGRRNWAYSTFRDLSLSDELATTLANNFRKRGDQEALHLIARNPNRVATVGASFLLENLIDEYWRARVVEAVLIYDRESGLQLAASFPFEFAHAVGRLADSALLEPLCALFEDNCNDAEFLSIYAYALGKLKAESELLALRAFVDMNYSDFRIAYLARGSEPKTPDPFMSGPHHNL